MLKIPVGEINNVGGICDQHSKERHDIWQKNNAETKLDNMFVKVPFVMDKGPSKGSKEWMWVLVKKDNGKPELKGKLANDPLYCKSLKIGDKVTISRSDIVQHMKND